VALLEADAPTAVEAELLCLGILLDPLPENATYENRVAELVRNVDASDFWNDGYRAIFKAVLAALDRHEPTDLMSMSKVVPDNLRPVLADVARVGLCHSVYAGFYAAQVREAAIKRRSIQAAASGVRELYDPQRTAQEAIDNLRSLLDSATTGLQHDSGVFTVTDLNEEVDALYEHGSSQGVCTGWPKLDECYRIAPGEWTLITGIPSHGKSAFVDALTVNLARWENWRFAVCSPENQPVARHIAKLARIHQGKRFDRSQWEPRMNVDELTDAKRWLHEHFEFVLPHESERTVRGVLGCMESIIQKHDLNGIVIDPWNELDHSRPASQTETEFISESLTRIRQFARRYRVHVWLVAHPAKLQRPPNDAAYPVPRPYDVSGSAHWFNKADNALAVYRDDADAWTQIHIQKIRFDQNGKRGMVQLHYNTATGQYTE
jgi:replicative DNA helicase